MRRPKFKTDKTETSVSSFHRVREAVETTTAELADIRHRYLPLSEVARVLGKTEDAVRMAIHKRVFPVPSQVLLGRRLFRVEDVHRFLAENYLRGLRGLTEAKDRALPLSWEGR